MALKLTYFDLLSQIIVFIFIELYKRIDCHFQQWNTSIVDLLVLLDPVETLYHT